MMKTSVLTISMVSALFTGLRFCPGEEAAAEENLVAIAVEQDYSAAERETRVLGRALEKELARFLREQDDAHRAAKARAKEEPSPDPVSDPNLPPQEALVRELTFGKYRTRRKQFIDAWANTYSAAEARPFDVATVSSCYVPGHGAVIKMSVRLRGHVDHEGARSGEDLWEEAASEVGQGLARGAVPTRRPLVRIEEMTYRGLLDCAVRSLGRYRQRLQSVPAEAQLSVSIDIEASMPTSEAREYFDDQLLLSMVPERRVVVCTVPRTPASSGDPMEGARVTQF